MEGLSDINAKIIKYVLIGNSSWAKNKADDKDILIEPICKAR